MKAAAGSVTRFERDFFNAETPFTAIEYQSEWAGGDSPYGWYSDQHGYRSLTACRT